MIVRRIVSVFIFILLLGGCALFERTATEKEPVIEYPAPDSSMTAMLETFRPALERRMNRKIATVSDTIRFGKPESALGNLVADALRNRAAHELQQFVHVGIIGESSFNIYFKPGDLTLGDIYEFMPYENHLVVLTLTGEQLAELIAQVAEIGGAPVSGVRFTIDEENKPRGILVNSSIIEPEREYRVATSSWAANGGDRFPALWTANEKHDIDVSVRQIFADYFRIKSELTDFTDGRIRR
jgi:2',3'-cyclic-nucleotide 2'-phosphodiesterase (5'-nucleotidase family)